MACDKELLTNIGRGTRAVVVGGGRSGRAAAKLLRALGAAVRLLDKKAEALPEDFKTWAAASGVSILGGEHKSEHFYGAEIVVPSPGAAVSSLRPLMPENGGPEIVAETELAWRHTEGEPVLAVTGTSGKTTTTSICAAMLQAQGLDVFTGGNIGTPLSEYVLERLQQGRAKADALVLELSSFQLQTCSTLKPRVAVLLNISENHLDYHADMKEYISAKMRLFRCQDKDDLAVFGKTLKGLPDRFRVESRQIYFDPEENRFEAMKLLGGHNQANAEAAWQACREFGVTVSNARKAVAEFEPLPHRLERIAEIRGVLYVNDSKCTTVDALRVALAAMSRPTWLLAGGKFKGGDLAGLIPLLKEKAKGVMLYGGSREIFENAWQGQVAVTWDETLAQAVARAAALAAKGDAVLLAPATSSYDQYRDYLARGNDFRQTVLGSAQ